MAKINDLKLGRKIADAEDEQNLTAAAFVGSEDTAEEEEKGILLAGICERFLAWLVDFLPFFLLLMTDTFFLLLLLFQRIIQFFLFVPDTLILFLCF